MTTVAATTTTTTVASRGTKLKILALHGWKQNGDRFRVRTGAFRKLVRSRAEFDFVSAPFVEGSENEKTHNSETAAEEQRQLTWFFPNSERTVYKKWEESVLYLRDYMAQNGPYDGVMAFSQGTTMALLLAALQSSPNASHGFGTLHDQWLEKAVPPVRFVIMVGGFVPRDREMAATLERVGCIDLPSLHIVGESDEIIRKEWSQQLMSHFNDSAAIKRVLLLHEGGHIVPHGAEVKKAVTEFLDSF